MQKLFILYRIDMDGDCQEWQVFDGAFSTKEKAEDAIERRKVTDPRTWGYSKPYEIEEEYLDEETS